eukprot:SAG25_NODE_1084_length_4077_cov_8.548768_4_plen_171_part_00
MTPKAHVRPRGRMQDSAGVRGNLRYDEVSSSVISFLERHAAISGVQLCGRAPAPQEDIEGWERVGFCLVAAGQGWLPAQALAIDVRRARGCRPTILACCPKILSRSSGSAMACCSSGPSAWKVRRRVMLRDVASPAPDVTAGSPGCAWAMCPPCLRQALLGLLVPSAVCK